MTWFGVLPSSTRWRRALQAVLKPRSGCSRARCEWILPGTSLLILPLERSTTAAAGAAIQFLLLPFLHCEP